MRELSVYQAILERRSIRSFRSDPIAEECIHRIIVAAQRAPSAGNRQPWFFYVVRNPKTKEALAHAAYDQDFIAQAPVVIVVCAEPGRSASRYGERGEKLYSIQDTAAAVENMLLTITEMGLGSCWVGAFDENRAAKVLSLPSHLRPVAMLPIGFPNETGRVLPRRSLAEIVSYLD